MNQTTIAIKTYACPECGYYQNADPYGEGVMTRMFPEFPGIPDGACPACYSGKNPQRVQQISTLETLTDTSGLSQTTVAGNAELESRTTEVLDEHGRTVMEQVGEHYELRVNRETGEIYSELVPDFAPKMRTLTKEEVKTLKTDRDDNLRKLEDLAV